MGFRWEQHRETCRQLYVEQDMSISEVVEYMRVNYNFTPSRRAFQGAFCRWGFPTKQNPAYKDPKLVARVKELWERNLTQKEMLTMLTEEGFKCGDRELSRIRHKNGWKLNGFNLATAPRRPGAQEGQAGDEEADSGDEDDETGSGDDSRTREPGTQEDQSNYWNYGATGLEPADAQVQEETLNAMREARRDYRRQLYETQAQERWLTKKRRRHTKKYAGLPPDPPCPPRFPSETTLGEAKTILQLEQKPYLDLREKFYNICVSSGVYKKTLVGPERWEALKDRLIRESMHLRSVMWDQTDLDKKRLAIEIIACDVTKRIRTEATMMKIAEAKVILGLNPSQGRRVRAHLYNMLVRERFTSKLEEGPDFFEELRQRWLAESPEMSKIMAVAADDPDYERKIKAVKAVCRDTMRRYRADACRLGTTPPPIVLGPEKTPVWKPKSKRKQLAEAAEAAVEQEGAEAGGEDTVMEDPSSEGPATAQGGTNTANTSAMTVSETAPGAPPAPVQELEPGMAPGLTLPPSTNPRRRGRPPGSKTKKKQPAPFVNARLTLAGSEQPDQQMVDAQLGVKAPGTTQQQTQAQGRPQQQQHQSPHPQPPPQAQRQAQPEPVPAAETTNTTNVTGLAAFFRLSPAAVMMFQGVQRQWIGSLEARTMTALKSAALQKTRGGLCYKIEGMVKDGKGGELPLPVSDDDELDMYLSHVEGKGAPTFVVHIVPGDDARWP
ncbi:hypothetical protein B0J18DRAFT_414975 [Chaetomium sp. MPI-SDFR-AT-0129]|nr:hypothetical protein B0J18DRAFT_414975 [Chaetomium sp. MPI-SDFR-AT-0129]